MAALAPTKETLGGTHLVQVGIQGPGMCFQTPGRMSLVPHPHRTPQNPFRLVFGSCSSSVGLFSLCSLELALTDPHPAPLTFPRERKGPA